MSEEQRVPLIPVATIGPLLVTKSGLAKALSVSERTVDYWRERGVIPFLQLSGRFVRFDVSEVRAALEKRYKVRNKAEGGNRHKETTS